MGGHGHVTPNPDGVVARCGGPSMCGDCARERMESGRAVLTGLRLSLNCEDWDVPPDLKYDEALEGFVYEPAPGSYRTWGHRDGFGTFAFDHQGETVKGPLSSVLATRETRS